MREHRRAPARLDDLDGLLGTERSRVHIRGLIVGQQPVEGLLQIADVAGVDERCRDVRPPHPAPGAARDVFPGNRVAELVETLHDALVAAGAIIGDRSDARRERLGPGRGQIGEQVHRPRGGPYGDLGAGHEAQPQALGGCGCLGEAGERVVVGQRERPDAERVRVLDQRGGSERPVGGRGMAVEVEPQSGFRR